MKKTVLIVLIALGIALPVFADSDIIVFRETNWIDQEGKTYPMYKVVYPNGYEKYFESFCQAVEIMSEKHVLHVLADNYFIPIGEEYCGGHYLYEGQVKAVKKGDLI